MSMTLELVAQRVEVLEKQMAMLLADKNVDVSDDKFTSMTLGTVHAYPAQYPQ